MQPAPRFSIRLSWLGIGLWLVGTVLAFGASWGTAETGAQEREFRRGATVVEARVTSTSLGRRNSLHATWRFEAEDPSTGRTRTYVGSGSVVSPDRSIAEHEGRLMVAYRRADPADNRPLHVDTGNEFILRIAFAALGCLLLWHLGRDMLRAWAALRNGTSMGRVSPFWKASDEAQFVPEDDERYYRK